ncbi:MAG: DUF2075 domain-containing protein, partial [Erysipelotrichia bacterium]|nr:DUF2075 domain-containing protein [Erysipelotrichia bacterium]
TIVIDEAGLISRAAGAALSMLGAIRVVWVGDPLQLAPISKSACAIAPGLSNWLTSSCLSHLQSPKKLTDNLVLLNEQHRMHPDSSRVVSGFQYENSLKNSSAVMKRQFQAPKLFQKIPRAIWHILDEENDSQISHVRGVGDKSWRRPITEKILQRLFLDPSLRELSGIFVTPFKAQAVEIAAIFKQMSLPKWKAATIHSFQGTEADIVILDTVFAGSRAWDSSEWKRLINVGISRGKHFALVIASRTEMSQPFLKPLANLLTPMFLKKNGSSAEFVTIKPQLKWDEENESFLNPDCLGAKIARLRSLRPVLSYEQQRLCNSDPDGKPRLVRGIAGSGKTYVLANWLVKALKRLESQPDACVFVVYGNHSLQPLLEENVARAWFDRYPDSPFPRKMVEYRHIKHLLEALFSTVRQKYNFEFEYDSAALAFLNRMGDKIINPICDAIFLDEAQDMGPNTLKLLFNLVKRSDPVDKNSRAIHIFYDNAQNLYDRETPKWLELGISLTGRSTIMKESFRSTRPISEYALNCLYRFQPPDSDHDYKELL